MIKFTIVTCTFNAEPVLQRTLDSVCHQTYSEVEHLIIDGLSKDRTVTMAMDYKQRSDSSATGHEVTIISEKDNGLYDAMNKGIRHATGTYIVFLNAGDVFPSRDTLDTIAARVGEGEALPGVLYGDTQIVNSHGHVLGLRRLRPPRHLTWRSFRRGMLVCHQAFYARTDLAKETPYDLQYRFSADVDWCIRIMQLCAKRKLAIRNVEEVIVNYLNEGMTEQNHKASLKERFHVMVNHYGWAITVLMHGWFVVRSVVKR